MADKLKAAFTGSEDLIYKLKEIAGAFMADELEKAAIAGALLIVNAAKENAPRKTATLARSLHQETAEKSDFYVEIHIGSDVVYAAIQEYGGTIVPKNVKFLAIPLSETAKTCVSPRHFAGKLRAIVRGSSGVLMDDEGNVHFALTTSAEIPARPYLRPAFDGNQAAAIEEIGRVLKILLEKAAQ